MTAATGTPPLLIRGGLVLDGTGSEGELRDVGLAEGRIVAPQQLPAGTVVIDAGGLCVAPGFIDAHTHSDGVVLGPHADPDLILAAVRQGVTTEIAGNCGSSLFPDLGGPHGAALRRQIGTVFDEQIRPFPALAELCSAHAAAGRPNHLTSLVGHSTLRGTVVGYDDRPATSAELAAMCSTLDRELASGCPGMSTGLIYPPGTYADTAEIVALATILARRGRPYVTHLRDEMAHVEDALDEAILIGRRSGAAVHVSHHKTAGRAGWGRTRRTLATMDAARDSGLDLTCDVYPYAAGSTHLHAMFPPWANDGGVAALLGRLVDPVARQRMRASIAGGVAGWENTVGNSGWDRIDIASAPRHPECEGVSIADLAAASGQHPVDWAADLLLTENAHVTVISRSMREDDVRRVLVHPGTMIGSDGVPRSGRPHPRWAGTFARVLGHYSRDEQLLSLADAINRMTGLTAARFGLTDRGVIRTGAHADLVVFDGETVLDRATFEEPLLPPTGVEHVLVAGVQVIRDGRSTGRMPGTVIAVD